MFFNPFSGGSRLGLDNRSTITARIFQKGVGRFGRRPIPTELGDRAGWVLTKIAYDLFQSFFLVVFRLTLDISFPVRPNCWL